MLRCRVLARPHALKALQAVSAGSGRQTHARLWRLRQHSTSSPAEQQSTNKQQQQQQPQLQQSDVVRWKPIAQLSRIPVGVYLELSKARLASLVTLTTMVGVALAPTPPSITTLILATSGTALCIASANTFNQLIESPYDAQMSRTRNRPLVRHAVSETHAASVAVASGVAGVATLACVNPLTAALGAANIALYAFVYTPLKRVSIANTWVGAVVGALPPMMGWTACTGSLALPDDVGAYVLGFLLYAWQFPHFNSLSWAIRGDYSKAGYRMMAVTDPRLNARVSLRYALSLIPAPLVTTYMGLTTPWFIWTSTPANLLMAYRAYKFYKRPDDKYARDLFFASLVHLPVVLTLMMTARSNVVQQGAEEDR
ncbi:Protoheme IX farnesyltransferase, mitochondrial [Sorochytrium milnesiophthora]